MLLSGTKSNREFARRFRRGRTPHQDTMTPRDCSTWNIMTHTTSVRTCGKGHYRKCDILAKYDKLEDTIRRSDAVLDGIGPKRTPHIF